MLADALYGLRVLDLSQYLPGPYATQILADLGAEVLKIEPPAGDPMRSFLLRDADGLSPWYKQINAGKAVLRLNLKEPADRAQLAQLLGKADVLLESYRPGVLERLGFSRERLRQLNPQLIHCALSGFGQDGPCRDRAGHDLTYMAASGMLHLIGTPAETAIPFPPISDYEAGKQAATAILAALLRRERTGQGAFLDISLFESVLSWQALSMTAALRDGEGFARGRDLLTGGAAFYNIYATSDGRSVALGAIEEKFWSAFCTAVERSDWIGRQHEPLPQRDLTAELRALFASRPLKHWQNLLQGVDCCFEPVLNPEEVLRHPQVAKRGLVRQRGTPDPSVEIALPIHCDGRPAAPRASFVEISAVEARAGWGID